MNGRGDPFSNPDLARRYPWTWGPGQVDAEEAAERWAPLPPGAFMFERIDRVSYAAPPATGLLFTLMTIPRDIRGGWILGVGIMSPEYDWFGTNEYFFALNAAQPYDYQISQSGGPSGTAGSSYAFAPVGSFENPAPTTIKVKFGDQWQLGIRPQAQPLAGQVVYNIITKTRGVFLK